MVMGSEKPRSADAARGPFDGRSHRQRRMVWGWVAAALVAVVLAVGWYAMDSGPFGASDQPAASTQPPAGGMAPQDGTRDATGAPATIPPAQSPAPVR